MKLRAKPKKQKNLKIKFKKSKKDKIIAGVLGGVAESIGVDSTFVRIVWLILLGLTGFVPGLIVYFLATIFLPVSSKK